MTDPSLTTLIGDDIEGDDKWWNFVDGKNGFFYGIPFDARRVVKFNPHGWKWMCGVRANIGSIYCAPYDAEHILKINTGRWYSGNTGRC
jgi:hypothetical protein